MSESKSLIRKATRKSSYLKIGLSGPSGSGKTYSSILLAKGLSGDLSKVVLIDTENGSGELYSNLGDYSVLPFEAPYHPLRYVKAIDYAIKEGFQYIIIDSISHEWDGSGGCLDIHTKLGGRFNDWGTVTPLHKQFIDAILQAKAHIIVTMRRKQDFVINEKDGRKVIEKMGLKEVQRDGFEYELTLNLNIEMNHLALPSKDRTELFVEALPFKIDESVGEKIRDWNLGK